MTNTTELLTDSAHPHAGVRPSSDFSSDPDPRWQLLHRVLESETFRRSQRLRDFLRFVGSHALEGRAEQITEHQIGVAVFLRGEHFNPTEDNIVRSTARALRNKLRDYFEHEGAGEPFRIEIPKGGYTPIFVEAPPTKPASPETQRRSRPFTLFAACACIFCLAALALWLWYDNANLRALQSNGEEQRNFLSAILGKDFHLNVVTSDSLHVYMARFYPAPPRIEDYANGSLFGKKPPEGLHHISQDLWDLVRSSLMTQSDESAAAAHIAGQLERHGKVKVYHARSITMAMLQVGDHFVLLGGRRANPWSSLFEQDLNFAMEFPSPGASAIFRNQNPRPDEQKEYTNNLDTKNTGVTYARIVLRPGVRGAGKVVLANGNTGVATAAAASLLTQPRILQELESRLGRRVDSSLQQLEMIVENRVVGGNTKDIRIVAIR